MKSYLASLFIDQKPQTFNASVLQFLTICIVQALLFGAAFILKLAMLPIAIILSIAAVSVFLVLKRQGYIPLSKE